MVEELKKDDDSTINGIIFKFNYGICFIDSFEIHSLFSNKPEIYNKVLDKG